MVDTEGLILLQTRADHVLQHAKLTQPEKVEATNCDEELTAEVVSELTMEDKEELVQLCKDSKEKGGPKAQKFVCCVCERLGEAECHGETGQDFQDCVEHYCSPQ